MIPWTVVALVGLVFAFIVAMRALRARDGRFASAEEFRQLKLDMAAFIEASSRRFNEVDEVQKKLDARTGDARIREYPRGLRTGP